MTIAEYPKLINRRPAPDDDELYPSSDGEPMGETLNHVDLILDTIGALRDFFADRPDVRVAGNNFVYYTEGKNSDCVSPDTYVVTGVTRPVPKSFFTWLNDGRTPDDEVNGRIRSQFLGLDIFGQGTKLRFFDPKTRTLLPDRRELAQIAAAEKYSGNEARRVAAEARIRADEQKTRADEARSDAAHEKKRADDAIRREDEARGEAAE